MSEETAAIDGRGWAGLEAFRTPPPALRRSLALATGAGAGEVDVRLTANGWVVRPADPPAAGPADARRLPGLAALVDAVSARSVLSVLLGAALSRVDPVLLRYRPGQRATVRCALTYSDRTVDPVDQRDTVIAKALRRGADDVAAAALRSCPPDTGRLRLARLLAHDRGRAVVVQSHLAADRDLVALIRSAMSDPGVVPGLARDLAMVGDALAALHGAPPRAGAHRDIAGATARLRAANGRLAGAAPAVRGVLDPVLDVLAARAPARPARLTFVHGAFRPAQVRLDGDLVGLIDIDKAGAGDPSEDVGRFVAKLRVIGYASSGGRAGDSVVDALAASFVDAYAVAAGARPSTLDAWQVVELSGALLQTWTRGRLAMVDPVLRAIDAPLAGLGRPS